MEIILNGRKKVIKNNTVDGLLKEFNINPIGKVVMVNGKVVHWADYKKSRLKNNDEVEFASFIGGGQNMFFCKGHTKV